MPSYYQCGCEFHGDDESDDGSYGDEDCPDCRYQDMVDDDSSFGSGGMATARSVGAMVDSLLEGELPIMFSPNLVRPVSCEWEGTSGVVGAMDTLRGCVTKPIAHFEHHGDSTCDGELVFGRLRLSDRTNATNYARALATIQGLHREGLVTVGMRAGHHIHVSARDEHGRGMSASSLVSLYSVYCHCEDLLYRLASAGWRRHRNESAGDWAKPIRKLDGAPKTPRNVGNAIGGDKYQGLNVSNYIGNIRNCRCGAFQYGDWSECTCPDDRATIEWRLWNACISPRKIRAYIAISHTLTAYAHTTDPGECSHLLENPFTDTNTVNEDSLSRQLDYLLSRPGFTARDRDDVMWLASISPGMGSLARDYEELMSDEPSLVSA